MYQFKYNINDEVFFRFDKWLIENLHWAELPPSSKSVFPVIGVHCNRAGIAFPKEETIAILSGRTEKTCRGGINGLKDFPGFSFRHYITARGKRSRRFYLKLPSTDDKGRAFAFHRCIVDGGNWLLLKPTAQALYPVMRHFGFFDFRAYCDLYEIDCKPDNFDEVYKARGYDFCEAEVGIMAEHAGISTGSMAEALKNLQDCFLIEPMGAVEGVSGWRVFLRPAETFEPADLNRGVMERHRPRHSM